MTKLKAAHTWDRDPHDWYVEPGRCTHQMLNAGEDFPGFTHDPCCGGGNIVRAMRGRGHEVTGSDLIDRPSTWDKDQWHLGVSDFLGDGCGLFGADNCVFNPPFYQAVGAEACIRRALHLAPGKVAAFVDIRFIAGGKRAAGLFADHPPSRIWVVTPRASCPPGAWLAAGNTAGSGTADYAWLVWDAERRAPGRTSDLGWLS